MFWDSSKRQITDFWKIPDFWEVFAIRTDVDDFNKQNLPMKLYSYNLDLEETEEQRRSLPRLPHLFSFEQKIVLKKQVPILNQFDLQNADASIQ